MKNLPQKIYLQIGENCPDDIDFKELSEITWSIKRIFNNDLVFELVSEDENTEKPDFNWNFWNRI